MIPVFERKCKVCGKPFPPGTVATKRYCDPCREKLAKEREAKRKEERRSEREKAAKENLAAQNGEMTILRKADMAYCAKCIYRGSFSESYLCNYLMMTCERRGCRAGVGCDKRDFERVEVKDNRNVCERCGRRYDGTKRSHFCPDCRVEMHRENARRMLERRKEKRHEQDDT